MYELIKIENTTIGSEAVPTVNARELHEFLESKQDYSTWIKKRIDDYEFLENKDYIVFHKKKENPLGGRPVKEYHITIETAKELSMVERNDKGKQARKYFIECEKKLQRALPQTYSQALRELADSWDREQVLIVKNKEMKPKADIYDAIIESKNTFSMANTAQIINIEKMGRNKLMAWLRAKDVLKSDNTPYQKYINKGWFELKLTPTVNGPKPCSRATPKGIEGILHLMAEAQDD